MASSSQVRDFGNRSLDEIGLHFGTDKASSHHGYLKYYERYFSAFRTKPIKLLEVGVFGGASLKTWEAYFANGAIVGTDIDQSATKYETENISIEIGDQSNIDDLLALSIKHGPFDIVIEDGSHIWNHQITTLKALYPFVKTGGIYVVEDLQTNWCTDDAFYRGNGGITCVEYLKKALDYRVAGNQLSSVNEPDDFLRTYASTMNLSFIKHACIIEKLYERKDVVGTIERPIISSEGAKPFRLVLDGHVGFVGSVHGRYGSISSPRPDGNLQGFTVASGDQAVNALTYRARLGDGSWTDWQEVGNFVGTKAKGVDLTGFSVDLKREYKGRYKLRLAGAFRNQKNITVVNGPGDCVSSDAKSSMHAMQIVIEPA